MNAQTGRKSNSALSLDAKAGHAKSQLIIFLNKAPSSLSIREHSQIETLWEVPIIDNKLAFDRAFARMLTAL